MLNHVCLMGRLTADPVMKRLPDGTPMCQARIAVDRNGKDKNGQKKADFFSLTAWRATAEHLYNRFKKGMLCVVDGRLSYAEWNDAEGQKHSIVSITVDWVYFAESKKDSAARRQDSGYYAEALPLPVDEDDEELPFK